MTYYELFPDMDINDAWSLDDPRYADGRAIDVGSFSRGTEAACVDQIIIPFDPDWRHGRPVDFWFAGVDTPVVSHAIGEVFGRLAANDVQRIAVTIENGTYREILNILPIVDCLDEGRSVLTRNPLADDRHAGKPNMVITLRIDPTKAGHHRVFRIKDWEGPIIVSADVRDALERLNVTGMVFTPVT